jgi:hypothetical protein
VSRYEIRNDNAFGIVDMWLILSQFLFAQNRSNRGVDLEENVSFSWRFPVVDFGIRIPWCFHRKSQRNAQTS